MSPLVRLAAEAAVALCALVQTLLAAYLVVKHLLAGVPGSWAGPLTHAAEALLWPLARPTGRAPAELGAGLVVLAMALYLALTCLLLAGIALLARPRPLPEPAPRARPPHPPRLPPPTTRAIRPSRAAHPLHSTRASRSSLPTPPARRDRPRPGPPERAP